MEFLPLYLAIGLIVALLCALPWWISACDRVGIEKGLKRERDARRS